MPTAIATTINHLKTCQQARSLGYPVSYTTDPAWLLHMAINRRAGWPDDPSEFRGSCKPVGNRYPKKAQGSTFNHLRNIARAANTRCALHFGELGEWRTLILDRIPWRVWEVREDFSVLVDWAMRRYGR